MAWCAAWSFSERWNTLKKQDNEAVAWWSENAKSVYVTAFTDLDHALRDYIKSKKGQRKGVGSASRGSRSAGSAGIRSG